MEDGRIISTVGILDGIHVWRLIGLLVHPEKRGQGYGTDAVKWIIYKAQEAGRVLKIATLIPDYFSRFGFERYDEPFKSGIVKMRYG